MLFRIPLPQGTFALAHALVAVAVAGLIVAELGRRARALDLVLLGVGVAAGCLYSASRSSGVTFELESLPLYGFGVLLCAALVGGWFLTLALAERDGLSRDVIAGCYFTASASGFVGARILYVLTNLGDFHSLADVFAFRSGGLVFYGGVAGGFVGSVVYARRRRIDWFAWADVAAPSLALGSVLGRVGCYLAGCDYGIPLAPSAPAWLTRLGTFPRWPDDVAGPGAGSPAWADQVLYRGLSLDSVASLPVHPTQLYESAAAGALLIFLLALRERAAFRGQVFLAYIGGYGLLRFVLEAVRDDPERGFYGPVVAPRVLVALGLAVVSAALALGPARQIRALGIA